MRKQYKLSGRRLLIWHQTALAQLYCGYVVERNYVIDYLLYYTSNVIHGEKQQKQQKQQVKNIIKYSSVSQRLD